MTTVSYNREKAVSYAEKWAFSRNPRYMSFLMGSAAIAPALYPNASMPEAAL